MLQQKQYLIFLLGPWSSIDNQLHVFLMFAYSRFDCLVILLEQLPYRLYKVTLFKVRSPVALRLITGFSLLDVCPSLLDFISSVVDKTSSDPSILAFALKLTGLLAASEEGFTRLQVEVVTLYYSFTKSRLLN